MTSKHQSPEYQRNARTIRARVKVQHKHGQPVPCWKCGLAILPGQPFDVGHISEQGGEHMTNLAPEHRGENRSHGGRLGAAITQGRRTTTRQSDVTSWPV